MSQPASTVVPLFRADLVATGTTDDTIAAAVRSATLQRVRWGAVVPTAEWELLDDDDRSRLLIAATVPKLGADSIVSHVSAARWHGLPVVDTGGRTDTMVHVIRNRASGGYRKGAVHAHPGVVDPGQRAEVRGVPVTSVGRTIIDCSRLLPYAAGLAMADWALQRKLITREELVECVDSAGRQHGVARARAVVAAASPLSESVGETMSRVVIAGTLLPAPVQQHRVYRGVTPIARCDFGWPELRVVGEFDGRVKYGRLLKPGQHPGDVVWKEKLREDAIRELGWEIVRWIWSDLADPAALEARIRRAMARAARWL